MMGLNRAALIARTIEEESRIFEDALHLLENAVSQELASVRDRASKCDPSDHVEAQYLDALSDEGWALEDRIFPTLYYGLLLSLYTEIEDCLLSLCCGYMQARSNLHQDTSRWGIRHVKDFLKRDVGVTIPDQGSEWQELVNFKNLRDCLAHRKGYLTAKELNGALGTYINQHSDLQVGKRDRVVIDRTYLEHMLEVARSFFTELREKLPSF